MTRAKKKEADTRKTPGTPIPREPEMPGTGPALRNAAERELEKSPIDTSTVANRTKDELIHELEVHQIELEMQADELKRTYLALEESRDKYLNLYEFAPVGYLTLTEQGIITGANLSSEKLLGLERRSIGRAPFSKFIAKKCADKWYRYFRSVLGQEGKKVCTFVLKRGDGSEIPVRCESVRIPDEGHGTPEVRVAISDISDLKRTEDALRESEHRFRTFFENAPEYCYIVSDTGIILDINPEALQGLGYDKAEIVGKPLSFIYTPDCHPRMSRLSRKWKETGTLHNEEMSVRTKTGEIRNVLLSAHRQVSFDGKISSITMQRDITERSQAELYRQLTTDVLKIFNEPVELQEAIRRVANAIKRVTGADVVEISLAGNDDFPCCAEKGFSKECPETEKTRTDSGTAPEIWGDGGDRISLECTCGKVLAKNTNPANPLFTPGGSAWTNDAFPTQDLSSSEKNRPDPDNTCFQAGFDSIAIIPIRKNLREIIGLLRINARRKNLFKPVTIQHLELIGTLIGEALVRRQAESEVRRLSEERKVLIDNVPAMIWFKDTHNRFIRVNPAAAKAFGTTVDEIEGKTAEELFPDIAVQYYRDDLEVISSGLPKFGIIEQMQTASGQNLWVRTEKIPLKNMQGTVTGLLIFSTDITEVRLAEEELTRKTDAIIAVNKELTIAGRELQQKEAKLRVSLEEKDALLSEVHHRVKNNLAAFISLLSLDGSYEDSEAGKRLRTDLQNRARSMALIHETLYNTGTYTKVDMGMYLSTLTSQVANTYILARPVMIKVDAHGLSLDLRRTTPCGLIVNELITNAFKYAFPASFDCEKIRSEPCTLMLSFALSDGVYTLSVRDNGIGIPETFNLETAKSLGLKLVNFLSKHQLRASVEVLRENGTEFRIRFRENDEIPR